MKKFIMLLVLICFFNGYSNAMIRLLSTPTKTNAPTFVKLRPPKQKLLINNVPSTALLTNRTLENEMLLEGSGGVCIICQNITPGNYSVINLEDYTSQLGSGQFGTAYMNINTKRVYKKYGNLVKNPSLEELTTMVDNWNDVMMKLGYSGLASARVVSNVDGKLYFETPFIDGKLVSLLDSEAENNMQEQLVRIGYIMDDIDGNHGNFLSLENGKYVPVDFDSVRKISKEEQEDYISARGIISKDIEEFKQLINSKTEEEKSAIAEKNAINEANGGNLSEQGSNPAELEKANLADSGDVTKEVVANTGKITTENKTVEEANVKNEVKEEDSDLAKNLEDVPKDD